MDIWVASRLELYQIKLLMNSSNCTLKVCALTVNKLYLNRGNILKKKNTQYRLHLLQRNNLHTPWGFKKSGEGRVLLSPLRYNSSHASFSERPTHRNEQKKADRKGNTGCFHCWTCPEPRDRKQPGVCRQEGHWLLSNQEVALWCREMFWNQTVIVVWHCEWTTMSLNHTLVNGWNGDSYIKWILLYFLKR